MAKRIRLSLMALALTALALAGIVTPVSAMEGTARSNAERGETVKAEQETETETETHNTGDAKQRVQGKLDEAKKKVCAARLNTIKKVMTDAGAMVQRHMETFDKIATRVEEFYTNKKLNVANYDELVAAVNSKKAAAQAAIATVKSQGGTFDCSGTNPVGSADQFKASIKAAKQALKDYRTAITNLIVAVKSAAVKAEGGAQ